jgi:hypothetical protein
MGAMPSDDPGRIAESNADIVPDTVPDIVLSFLIFLKFTQIFLLFSFFKLTATADREKP